MIFGVRCVSKSDRSSQQQEASERRLICLTAGRAVLGESARYSTRRGNEEMGHDEAENGGRTEIEGHMEGDMGGGNIYFVCVRVCVRVCVCVLMLSSHLFWAPLYLCVNVVVPSIFWAPVCTFR